MKLSKRTLVLLGVMVVAVAASIGAYAYWTTSGSGNGNATVAASNSNIVISNTTDTGLTPGGTVLAHVTLTNNNPGSAYVGVVHGAVSLDPTNSAGTLANCVVGDFSVADHTFNATVAGGGTGTFDTNLSMADTALDQNACKSALLDIAWTTTP